MPLIGKEWKTKTGAVVHGDFVSSEEGVLIIKSIEGREVKIRRNSLIEADRKFLVLLENTLSEVGVQAWPRKIPNRSEVRLKGGPRTFRTEHFQIVSGGADRVTVASLATIMEDTLEAISAIPTGLELKPPAPSTYFQARFMDRVSFDREFSKVGMHLVIPSQQVKGAYIAAKRELWLPVGTENIGVDALSPTMIHEVCHQTMHEWLPLVPVWFLEGFAEYMASVPYEYRTFRFDKSEQGLRKALASRYRMAPSSVNVIHPLKLIHLGNQWQNTTDEYASALILVYYLIHLDGSGNGDSFKEFVAEVANSKDDARGMIGDLQSIADTYNSRVNTYRKEIADYQRKMADVRSQMRSGQKVFIHSRSNGRLVIGGTPPVPRVPSPPGEAPVEQISGERAKTLNFITQINQKAVAAMIGNRSTDEFIRQMEQAFLKKGFILNFH
ncbi:MAG: hypothetical protein P1V20_18730 [Verrucomicrobiales bacterium]|nr:hypothetical protein [Verrucomicrobiales bacterium]